MTPRNDLPDRNEPCYCGSGTKFKKCHWPKVMEQRVEETKRQQERAEEAMGAMPHPDAPPGGAAWRRRIRDPGLRRRVDEIQQLLADKGITKLDFQKEEAQAEAFQTAARKRWEGLAGDESELVATRRALFEADDTGGEPPAQAVEAFAAAGEAAVPHLGIALMTPSWASVLAARILVEHEPGPLRDRAVAEGLFVEGDYVPDTLIHEVKPWDGARALAAFRPIAHDAAADGAELGSVFWTGLFEVDVPYNAPTLPVKDEFAQAVRIAYERGHHGLIAQAFDYWMDPGVSGDASVREFVDSKAATEALEFLRTAPMSPRLSAQRTARPAAAAAD